MYAIVSVKKRDTWPPVTSEKGRTITDERQYACNSESDKKVTLGLRYLKRACNSAKTLGSLQIQLSLLISSLGQCYVHSYVHVRI